MCAKSSRIFVKDEVNKGGSKKLHWKQVMDQNPSNCPTLPTSYSSLHCLDLNKEGNIDSDMRERDATGGKAVLCSVSQKSEINFRHLFQVYRPAWIGELSWCATQVPISIGLRFFVVVPIVGFSLQHLVNPVQSVTHQCYYNQTAKTSDLVIFKDISKEK